MEKKTVLALVLSALVLLAWQFYIGQFQPDEQVIATSAVEQQEQPVAEIEVRKAAQEYHKPSIEAKDIYIETDKFDVTLTNEGGCIKSIALKEYPDPRTGEIFKLVDVKNTEEGIFNIENLGAGYAPTVTYDTVERGNEVIFHRRFSDGLEVTKKYTFYNSLYHIELELIIKNLADYPQQTSYSIITAAGIDITGRLDRAYTHIVYALSGEPKRARGGKPDKGKFVAGSVDYAGLQGKYFSVIAKTDTLSKGILLRQVGDNNMLSAIEIEKLIINPSSSVTQDYLLYVGPNKEDIMGTYELNSAISYGIFGGISKVLLAGLKLFHRVFKNWGIAVILLSACVNLLLFPLSRKSYESMKKMQDLQPHMEKLKTEHKDNPHKLNKEMMDLYKKYNVNPMGGCLPLLLQMPIFISLYQALMRSLELKGARFLWITDLSMPDAVQLPFTLPILGNSINVLPILMAAAMVFQQKLSTRRNQAISDQQRQQQQMMMIMMPVIFLFIMYSFPSGLVLYWLTNTLLTMFEQRAIMHRQ